MPTDPAAGKGSNRQSGGPKESIQFYKDSWHPLFIDTWDHMTLRHRPGEAHSSVEETTCK